MYPLTIAMTFFAFAVGAHAIVEKAAAPPIVEVLGAGGLDTSPPAQIVAVFANGKVVYRGKSAMVPKREVKALQKKLKAMGVFLLRQAELDKQLVDAGSGPAAYRRGGSGKFTLAFLEGKDVVKVALNGPQHYAGSKIRFARIFHDVWATLMEFGPKAVHAQAAPELSSGGS